MMTHADRIYGAAEAEGSPGLTRRDVVRALFRHKWTVIACTVAVTLTVIAGLRMLPAAYEADAKLLVRTETQGEPAFFTEVAAIRPRFDHDPVNRRIETEMELLETRPFAEAVVRELGLSYDQVYHKPLTHLLEPVMAAYDWAAPRLFGVTVGDRKDFDTVVEAVRRSVTVQPVQSKSADVTSNLVEVHFRAADPTVARRGLEVLLATYTRHQTALNDDAATAALAIVTAEADAATARLAAARSRLRDHLATSPFAARAAASVQLADRGAVDAPGGTMLSPTAMRSGARLAELDERLTALELELLRTRQIYREESDTVVTLRQQIDALRGAVGSETRTSAGDFSRLVALERDLRVAEVRAAQLEDRRAEIALYQQANITQPPDRVVVEPPLAPRSSDWKKRVAIGVMGTCLGLFLGLALAGAAELADPTFPRKDLVRRWLGLDVFTVVPESTPAQLRALVAPVVAGNGAGRGGGGSSARRDESGGPAPAVRALAARLVSAFPESATTARRGRSVLVTSARPREGKTVVAHALAVQMSRLGYGRIMLVDTDLASLNAALPSGAPLRLAAAGVTTFAGGEWTATDESVDAAPSLSVMAAAAEDGGRPLNARALYPLLDQASRRFDWIIFDGGCLDDGDVSRLSHVVDAMLLVVDAPRTRRQVVRDSLGTLPVMPGRITGVVLNNVRHEIPAFLYHRV